MQVLSVEHVPRLEVHARVVENVTERNRDRTCRHDTGREIRAAVWLAAIKDVDARCRRIHVEACRPVDARTILYTGLTRDGTFLIENGKITRAVKNLRFNESPIFMLNNIDAMGMPVRVSASESGGAGMAIVVPPIKVREFTFTSMSDAI